MITCLQQQIASDMFLPNLLIVEDIDIKLGTHVYILHPYHHITCLKTTTKSLGHNNLIFRGLPHSHLETCTQVYIKLRGK